ncbi:MAG: transcriptional regulator [Pseudomonadota bacterium]
MTSRAIDFGPFRLDRDDRRLTRDGEPVDLNARYFDALVLLADHPGQLISKDRFLDEVWRGVPVTDEALTQCIKTLRRALGDDAAAPRFIETVPKHGYRFIAPIDGAMQADPPAPVRQERQSTLLLAGAGTIGGGMAGLVGGLVYGIAGVSRVSGGGELSVLLVVVCLCVLAGLIGGIGVAGGIAIGLRGPNARAWKMILGGAIGGMVVGAGAKLLGLDAFSLLVGRAPGDITGGAEATLLGAATGLGAWLSRRPRRGLRTSTGIAALIGGVAGGLIALIGGTLMAGSLDALATGFPDSRLTMHHIGAVFGEPLFGPITRTITCIAEATLFAAGCVGAMMIARRDSFSSLPPNFGGGVSDADGGSSHA